jgi:DNA-binding XRE family transcriptional regulator
VYSDDLTLNRNLKLKERQAKMLSNIGEVLYGTHWRAPIASALSVSKQTIHNWESNRYPMPDWVKAQLYFLLLNRQCLIHDLLKELRTPPKIP